MAIYKVKLNCEIFLNVVLKNREIGMPTIQQQ
jgi:hypothetical protein